MSDETSPNPDMQDTEGAASTGAGTGTGEEISAARLAQLEAEVATLKDQLMRSLAEQENLRRRTEREVRDANTYAVAKFARDVLSVGDNLRRALDAVSAETRASAGEAMTGLLDGVEMTERELLSAMERHGVRKIEPIGEKFNPNFHQAMFEVPNTELPNGTVMQVVQSGYVIGERVLRPALVGVTKGGPKADTAQPSVDKSS